MFFHAIYQNIADWIEGNDGNFDLVGASPEQWAFVLGQYLGDPLEKKLCTRDHLFICRTTEIAEQIHFVLEKILPNWNIFFIPGLENDFYGGILSSETDLYMRFACLSKMLRTQKRTIVLLSVESFLLKNPPPDFFKKHSFSLSPEMIISPFELAEKLVELGYSSSSSVESFGQFLGREKFLISIPREKKMPFDSIITKT